MNCERHVKNPSWYGEARRCYECAKEDYSEHRPQEQAGYPESFGGRSGMTDHAYHNPNSVYERAQAKHTIDRSKE